VFIKKETNLNTKFSNALNFRITVLILCGFLACINLPAFAQDNVSRVNPDEKVQKFLDSHKSSWHDMNVSAMDGKILYDLIVENNYTSALEIGTSTGHSGIWMAWALSKTGGKLTTIDIDEDRYNEAVKNFKEAGVSEYIDAKLADAHTLVPELKGPFDFVFCDADKYWLTNYLKAVLPKLEQGGCFVAHNVSDLNRTPGIEEFIRFIENEPGLKTEYAKNSRAGISVSYKK
jgi:caffeoyl-CoA O-methyltransferase